MRLADHEIEGLIEEDLRYGDLTTRLLGIGDAPGRITFAARDSLLLCGAEEAWRLLRLLGAEVDLVARDGERLSKGALVMIADGPAALLHAGWKAAQIVMEWASGIATLTDAIVASAKARAPKIQVLCTRKSIPMTRRLSLKAVLTGGAEIHRLGLSDSIMVFPEHLAFLGGPSGLASAIGTIKACAPERVVMVEVKTANDALAAAAAMADVIQLEKFSLSAVRDVVKAIRKREDGRPIIAAAGGINAQNAGDFAETGADTLITSAPFYARPAEISVSIRSRLV